MKTSYWKIFCAVMLFAGIVGCSDDDVSSVITDEDDKTETIPSDDEDDYEDQGDDPLDLNSQTLSLENMISIAFSSDGVSIENPFEGDGVAITVEGNHVVITSSVTTEELNYVLSGSASDGSVKIYGAYRFGLLLNGVDITNPSGAAINIQCGKKITVTIVDQTNNRLIDGETYVYTEGEDMKGTFFSEGQLNFYGNGSLELRGRNKHALCTDDYLRIYEGNIWVKEAASDALHAKDYVEIYGGALTTYSIGEGIDCDGYILIDSGTLNLITSGQKGHGIKSEAYITITGNPDITIRTEGIASKCLNATGDINIAGGTLSLKTTGDAYFDTDEADTSSSACIKSDGNLLIEGGNLSLLSYGTGGKGINVDGAINILDGELAITTTGAQYVYNKNYTTAAKAMKADGNLTISGGKIVVKTYQAAAEGIESKATLTISGGQVEVEAYDDCLNASKHIQIDGGSIYCNSSANDAIDSNGTLTITGGITIAAGTTAPDGGIDCDQSRFTISGGVVIGIGGDSSTPTSSTSGQPSLLYKGVPSGTSIIHIEETSGGVEVLTCKLPKTYNSSQVMLFSSNSLKTNTGYTIYTGGSISGGSDFYGYYTGSSYTKGSATTSFTTGSSSGSVTTIGSSQGQGGGR